MSWGFESLHAHKAVLPAAFFHFHLKNILCDEDFCRSDSRADDDATADDDAVLRAATDDGTPKRAPVHNDLALTQLSGVQCNI